MAISVRQFVNPLDCDEPANEISIAYHADPINGAVEICAGNGTLTNVYGDFASLGDLVANTATVYAANTDLCDDGIDVVFVIDYTASMGGAISGVKTGINNIISTLNTESAGNYRVGAVLYDEYGGQNPTYQYAASGYYQDIPATQKEEFYDSVSNHTQVYTCIEKMSTIGNSASVIAALNAIAGNNSSTQMKLGAGGGQPEPGGQAIYRAAANAFAGSWRSNVLKLIIHVTDAPEGGINDAADAADITLHQSVITPYLDANNIQLISNTSMSPSNYYWSHEESTYKYTSENTSPVGLHNDSLNYSNSNWVTALNNYIIEICLETTTYTCDPAAAGWYAGVPVISGTTIVYYWDGSAWTNSYSCPAPQYTTTVQINDLITNGSVDNIPLNHPNYGGSLDTFSFTGVAGAVFTATFGNSPDAGYNSLSVNVSNISDTNVVSATVNNINDEITLTITMPSNNSTQQVTVSGSASAIIRTMIVDIIGGVIDTLDATNNIQTPAGYIEPNISTPLPGGWTDVGFTYNNHAYRYTFQGAAGTTFTIDTEFLPSPSDYSLYVTGISGASEYVLEGTNTASAVVENAFNNMTFTAGDETLSGWSGTFTMPSLDGHAKVKFLGQVNQPLFRYTLYVSESITGAEMAAGDSQFIFTGYTGDTLNISALLANSPGYTGATATGVLFNNAYANNSALSNVGVISGGSGAECTITMPAGGGQGGLVIAGTADQLEYDFGISWVDNYSTASWQSFQFTGVAGSAHSTNQQALSVGGYSYNIQSVSDNSAHIVPSIVDSASLIVGVSLGNMPVGGGNAIITVNGEESQDAVNYTLNIITTGPVAGSWAGSTITLSAVPGTTIPGTFSYNAQADYTYTINSLTTSGSEVTATSIGTDLDTNYSVVMPNGGGSGTITINATATQTEHSYIIHYDNSLMTNGGNLVWSPGSQTKTGVTGSTHSWSIDLDPSPSYWDINIQNSNIILHDGASNPPQGVTLNFPPINSNDVISGNLTMPIGGGVAYVAPKGNAFNPIHSFTINASEYFTNASIDIPTITLTGNTGDILTHTFDIVSEVGYTHDATSTTLSNSYGGALTSAVTVGEDATVSLTMPSGGGSSTVYVFGSSTQVIYSANMLFDDAGTMASSGDWDSSNANFSGVAGDTFSIDNTWRLAANSGLAFYSNGQYAVNITPTTSEFSNVSTAQPASGATASRHTSTFTMPIGGGTWNITANGRANNITTTTTLPTYSCDDFRLSFNLTSGEVGDSIMNYVSWDGSPMGMIPFGLNLSFNVTTFQASSYQHTATFTVPSGYSNSGNSFQCNFGAIGTAPVTTTTTLPLFSCKGVLIGINSGAVGDSLSYLNGNRTYPAVTINSISPSTYQLGNTGYTFNIQVPAGYSNTGFTINCEFYGMGTTTTLPPFSCADTNLTIPNGAVGNSVLVNTNGIGTALSVNPSTYTLGTNQYVVTVRVPNGYSNAGNYVQCDVFGTGTTTTTAAPTNCDNCDGVTNGLFLQPDYQPEIGSEDGWLALWAPSDVCSFAAGTIKLYKSTTATGTYADIGTPSIWTYSDRASSNAVRVTGDISNNGLAQYIGNLGEGYYYIEGRDQYGCIQQSKSIWLANSNQVSNDWSYLYGVPCGAKTANGSTADTDRAQINMKLQGALEANQFAFQQGNYAFGIYNYAMTDILRVKVDNSITDATGSIETNIAYTLTGAVVTPGAVSYNSDLSTKIKFSGHTILPRPYSVGGNNANAIGDHTSVKISQMRGQIWGSNNKYMNQMGTRGNDGPYGPEGIETVNPIGLSAGSSILFAGVGPTTSCTSLADPDEREHGPIGVSPGPEAIGDDDF